MNLKESLEIVLELAEQNIIEDKELEEEQLKQTQACNNVQKFIDFLYKNDFLIDKKG